MNINEYNPLDRNYIYQYNKTLNIDKMKEATNYLIGEHDFTSFVKLDEVKDCVRIIYNINIELENGILVFKFEGNGFLRYMIRNLVGTLITVGEEKIEPSYIKEILDSKNRKNAFLTAPAQGLYLENVFYE
jgi:tRNA pseudouridine38-40 synthase